MHADRNTPDYSAYPAGYLFERNRQNKGLSRSALQPLRDRVVMEQTDEYRALDWYAVEALGKEVSLVRTEPTAQDPDTLYGQVRACSPSMSSPSLPAPTLQRSLSRSKASPCSAGSKREPNGPERLAVEIPLAAADYTIVTLVTPMFRPSDAGLGADSRKLGIAVTDIVLEPG